MGQAKRTIDRDLIGTSRSLFGKTPVVWNLVTPVKNMVHSISGHVACVHRLLLYYHLFCWTTLC